MSCRAKETQAALVLSFGGHNTAVGEVAKAK
jgi:hypothetical protein